MPNWTTDFNNAEQAEDYAAFAYRLEQQAERKAEKEEEAYRELYNA